MLSATATQQHSSVGGNGSQSYGVPRPPELHAAPYPIPLIVARQSSSYSSKKRLFPGLRTADIAVNGSTLAEHEWHCSHTEKDAQAWWDVDLGQSHDIDFVRIWNRRGPCASRIFPCWILLSEAPFPPWRSNTLTECRRLAVYEQCIHEPQKDAQRGTFNVVPPTATRARYVRVITVGQTFCTWAKCRYFRVALH